jgi:hypothetical protein
MYIYCMMQCMCILNYLLIFDEIKYGIKESTLTPNPMRSSIKIHLWETRLLERMSFSHILSFSIYLFFGPV